MTEAEEPGGPTACGAAVAESERALRLLADNAPVLIRRSGVDKRYDWFNRPWLDFTGRAMEQELGFGWAEGVHPDDRDRCIETCGTAFDAGRPFSTEYRLRRHDGEYRWIREYGAPFHREDGRFGGYFGHGIDVTEQVEREAELRESHRRQQSLIDELNHRLKNTLATVHSIALQTFRKVPDVDGPLRRFDGRLSAVAASQDLLARHDWQGATLREAVEAAVRPFVGVGEAAISIAGPEVMLSPRQTTALSFALHELCSNAARFGALSVHDGRAIVEWITEPSDGGTRLVLTWREEGGPPVSPPSHKGFGSRMIERGLTHEFAATAEMTFRPEGLVCTIRSELGQEG